MSTESAVLEALSLASLPALKQPLEGGLYGGIITMPDGRNVAVVYLNEAKPPKKRMSQPDCVAFAKSIGGQLITRAIGALLVSTLGSLLPQEWAWTCDDYEGDASYAWYVYLYYGFTNFSYRSFERCPVVVRLIPLTS